MKTIYKNGMLSQNGQWTKMDFLVEDDLIVKMDSMIQDETSSVVSIDGVHVIPGFFDIHTHGAMGYDFNMASFDEMKIIMKFYLKNGVTSVLPTLLSDDVPTLILQLEKIATLQSEFPQIKGIHLEGPFLAPLYKGAMSEEYLQNASTDLFKKFQEAAKGLITLVTLSPEITGANSLIKYLKAHNVCVSLGHSGASMEETEKAIQNGAESFTHSFNAMKPFDHHHPGIINSLLTNDIYYEMICDGLHLHKDTVNLLVKLKGLSKAILVTDSIMATGAKDGDYFLGKTAISVKNGVSRLKKSSVRAGSTLTPLLALQNFVSYTNTPFEKAIELFSKNPASFLHLFNDIGSLEVSKKANFILLKNSEITSVYLEGIKIF